MNTLLRARVKESTSTTGTGTLSLSGAPSGYRPFVTAFGSGNPCYYVIISGTDWETGIGTVTSGSPDTLTRSLLESSTGSLLDLPAGVKTVFCDAPPQAFVNGNQVAVSAGDTTPSVASGNLFFIHNTASVNVTTFDDGIEGQEITILVDNSNTTIINGSPIKLAGASNWTMTNQDILCLIRMSSAWYEKSRSVN